MILKLKRKLAFDTFRECQSTGRFVLIDGYDVSGGGIILSAEESITSGTTFMSDNLTVAVELFDEFYYDVERRQITHVSETESKVYQVGDKVQISGFSFDYPADFDIIILTESATVSIRGQKVVGISSIEDYTFNKLPLINGRGFGIKVNTAEQFSQFIKDYQDVKNPQELAQFSNKYFFLNQYRQLKFYFDYVI